MAEQIDFCCTQQCDNQVDAGEFYCPECQENTIAVQEKANQQFDSEGDLLDLCDLMGDAY